MKAHDPGYLEAVQAFAARFVRKSMRERAVHEALNKTWRLVARVSHDIEILFPETHRGGSPHAEPDSVCYLLNYDGTFGPPFRKMSWAEALRVTEGGGQTLIIGERGDWYFAETEGQPPTPYGAGAASQGTDGR